MTKIKICGLWRMEDIEVVNEMLPEYIGFVFAKSKRQVTPEEAKKLRNNLDSRIQAVGVFVNEKVEKIVELARQETIQVIQLHGHESEVIIATLKKLTQIPIIKAVSLQTVDDLKRWEKTQADYLLLDGPKGGSGISFNWESLNESNKIAKPFFLAGGIRYDNVKEVIDRFNPFAVDMSSGIETVGIKDPQKIRQIVRRIRDEEG